MAVCPAGEDVIGPFLDDRKGFLETVVSPLQAKEETLYVVPGSDAQDHARKRFPHKTDQVGRQRTAARLDSRLLGEPAARLPAEPIRRVWRRPTTSRSPGQEPVVATVVIRDKTIRVEDGHVGSPDLSVTADSQAWLGFVRKERSLVWALLTRKIRLKGSPRLLVAFGKCFPS